MFVHKIPETTGVHVLLHTLHGHFADIELPIARKLRYQGKYRHDSAYPEERQSRFLCGVSFCVHLGTGALPTHLELSLLSSLISPLKMCVIPTFRNVPYVNMNSSGTRGRHLEQPIVHVSVISNAFLHCETAIL